MAPSQRSVEKPVLAGLVLFGIAAIVLGMVNLKRAIGPSIRTGATPIADAVFGDRDADARALLSGMDTDGDGIMDLEEFERTFTSPYLADSDSDGRTDREEIQEGTDPNCPSGRTCAESTRSESAPPTAPAAPAPTSTSTAGQATLSGATLRRALLEQGMPQATLDAISDAELETLFAQQIGALTNRPDGTALPFGAALGSGLTAQLSGASPSASILDALPKDPASIRAALAQGGVASSQLNALSDAELLALWEETLADLRERSTQPP